jgi:hypothetical protein
MPLWAASAWALWRAVDRSTSASWAVAGLLAAATLYAKLSSVAFLAAAAVWLMSDAKARRTLATPAPWLGGAVFLISVAPLAWSIYADGFKPLAYASARSHSGGIALLFAPKLVGSMAGAIAVAAYAGLMPSRLSPKSKLEPAPVGARAWRFLLFLGLGPVILVTTIFELAGMGLRSSWGAPMTVLVGLIVVAADPRFTSFKLTRVARGAASLLIAVPMGYAGVTVLSARMAGHVQRVSWPQAEMAARFRALWQRDLGGPLGIVAGPDWIAGLVALDGVHPASVLFNSRLDENRRLSSETLRRAGFLIVWDADDPLRAMYQMRNWTAGRREGVETFHWPFANAGELRIGYALIPPAGDRGSGQ